MIPEPKIPETQDICEECVLSGTADTDVHIERCVRCPFCQQTVNAIITKQAIKCPKCLASARL